MALREILASFGFSIDDSKLKKASGTVDRVASGMRQALGVFAAGAVVAGVRSFISDIQETADQLIDTSAQLGVSANDLQRWQLAAKLSGAQANDLAVSLKNVQKNGADPSKGGMFDKLGVKAKDANGQIKPAAQLFRETGLAINAIKNPTERTAKALEVFGKSGNKMIPIFEGGAEQLDKLLGRLDDLGGGLGDDALEILEKSGDATDELSVAFLSLKSRLAVSLFPALRSGIEWLSRTFASLSKSAKGSKIFQSAAIVMAGAIGIALISLYASFLPIIAVIAAAILIVDDLWTTWEGGDSVTKRAIDAIFGIGTTEATIRKIKDTWADLNAEIDRTPGGANKARVAFSALAEGAKEGGAGALASFRDLYDSLRAEDTSWTDIGQAWIDALLAPFTGLQGLLLEKIKPAAEDAFKSFDDWARKAFKTGVDFVLGIAQGIGSSASLLYDAITDLGKKALQKLKDAFKSHSPSKAAADISESVPQGGARGFRRGEPGMSRAAGDLGRRAIDALREPMSFSLTTGQKTSAAPASRGGGGPIQVTHETRASVTIQGGSQGVRADVKRGVMDASTAGREALIADLEAVAG